MSQQLPEPLLIFSSGQRTGSTLLQRFILSNPRIMMWGEHDGVLGNVLKQMERLYDWDSMFAHELRDFVETGYNNFVPCMIPPSDIIQDTQRALLETLYREPALRMGRDIWGFKEVLYRAEVAVRLRSLYPNLKVLYITRHPFNCFVSLLNEERLKPYEVVTMPLEESWTRQRTIDWVKDWTDINESFLDNPHLNDDWVYRLTFEQLVADPVSTTGGIIDWLGLPRDAFDLGVFNHRLYASRNNGQPNKRDTRAKITWDDLSIEESLLITQPRLREVAARVGYNLPELVHEKRMFRHEELL
ncbi:MAG: sulfotransferase [Chloroflexota bacterium]